MIPLRRKEGESFVNKKAPTFAKKNLNTLVIKYDTVRDHCHSTVEYRSPAYRIFNLR